MRAKEHNGDLTLRRQQALEAAYQLFSLRSIEEVKMLEIAAATGIGMATLYRYFGSKPKLVIELGAAKWRCYAAELDLRFAAAQGGEMSAREQYSFYLDCFIDLYDRHPDLLRFNANFDQYLRHENAHGEDAAVYYESVGYFSRRFSQLYAKNAQDHTLRRDLPEQEFFVGSLYVMLALAQKFASGLIYPADGSFDCRRALNVQKEMLLGYVTA